MTDKEIAILLRRMQVAPLQEAQKSYVSTVSYISVSVFPLLWQFIPDACIVLKSQRSSIYLT